MAGKMAMIQAPSRSNVTYAWIAQESSSLSEHFGPSPSASRTKLRRKRRKHARKVSIEGLNKTRVN
jgi:hypothetical protein